MKFDLAISGASVMDPGSGLDAVMNLGVQAGRIAALTREPLEAALSIDGRGLVLSPGFIDIHTHEESVEGQMPEFRLPREVAACALATGNTTILGGNCGESNYPVGKYLEHLGAEGLPINCLTLIGSTTLRRLLGIGDYEAASPSQIARLQDLAREALDEGAVGVSFGLQYCPGTGFAEVLALCEAVRERGAFFAVHMRHDTPRRALETVEEVAAAARVTGAALQISHYAANVYGASKDGQRNLALTSRLLEDSGIDFGADMYPYDAWATYIKSAVFDNGFDDFNFGVTDLELLSGPRAGQYCTAEVFEELRHAAEDTTVACHNAIPPEDLEAVYRLPFVCPASDALMSIGAGGLRKAHPRAAGSPARFLREFVREKQLFSLMEGLRKLTLLPADRLGLVKKGRIQEGCDADLCLFDPATITDRAGFDMDTCTLPPAGIKAVICGGRVVFRG